MGNVECLPSWKDFMGDDKSEFDSEEGNPENETTYEEKSLSTNSKHFKDVSNSSNKNSNSVQKSSNKNTPKLNPTKLEIGLSCDLNENTWKLLNDNPALMNIGTPSINNKPPSIEYNMSSPPLAAIASFESVEFNNGMEFNNDIDFAQQAWIPNQQSSGIIIQPVSNPLPNQIQNMNMLPIKDISLESQRMQFDSQRNFAMGNAVATENVRAVYANANITTSTSANLPYNMRQNVNASKISKSVSYKAVQGNNNLSANDESNEISLFRQGSIAKWNKASVNSVSTEMQQQLKFLKSDRNT